MIRIQTASRLHFGFLSVVASTGLRRFGGAGLMIQEPSLALTLEPDGDWSALGPHAERSVEFARRFAASVPADAVVPQRIVIEQAAPAHAGLGSGTQLALAVAHGLLQAWGLPRLPAVELARRVGRGRRSALGIHGFDQGGFLVEAGKLHADDTGPLVARLPFPADWHILLACPRADEAMHGPRETEAIARLQGDERISGRLCRLVLLGLLPALAETNLHDFGTALYEFNRLVGELFAPIQGDTYAAASVPIVRYLRAAGIEGVAQSSWGPTVAAISTRDRLEALLPRVRETFRLEPSQAFITTAQNSGVA